MGNGPKRRVTHLPGNARRVHGLKPTEELRKAANKLYYGDENISEPPGKLGMFRGVVVVGAVLSVPEPGGDPVISCTGTWTVAPEEPGYYQALAEYLRMMADALEKEAMS